MGSTGVTESNMMAYLGIIEHRTNQLLHRYQVRAANVSGEDKETGVGSGSTRSSELLLSGANITIIGQGPTAPAGSVVIHVDPPLIGDDDESLEESDDEEERPLSRDELKAKTLRGITKRKTRQPALRGAAGGPVIPRPGPSQTLVLCLQYIRY